MFMIVLIVLFIFSYERKFRLVLSIDNSTRDKLTSIGNDTRNSLKLENIIRGDKKRKNILFNVKENIDFKNFLSGTKRVDERTSRLIKLVKVNTEKNLRAKISTAMRINRLFQTHSLSTESTEYELDETYFQLGMNQESRHYDSPIFGTKKFIGNEDYTIYKFKKGLKLRLGYEGERNFRKANTRFSRKPNHGDVNTNLSSKNAKFIEEPTNWKAKITNYDKNLRLNSKKVGSSTENSKLFVKENSETLNCKFKRHKNKNYKKKWRLDGIKVSSNKNSRLKINEENYYKNDSRIDFFDTNNRIIPSILLFDNSNLHLNVLPDPKRTFEEEKRLYRKKSRPIVIREIKTSPKKRKETYDDVKGYSLDLMKSFNDSVKDYVKDSIKDYVKDYVKDNVKDSVKDYVKDSVKDYVKDSECKSQTREVNSRLTIKPEVIASKGFINSGTPHGQILTKRSTIKFIVSHADEESIQCGKDESNEQSTYDREVKARKELENNRLSYSEIHPKRNIIKFEDFSHGNWESISMENRKHGKATSISQLIDDRENNRPKILHPLQSEIKPEDINRDDTFGKFVTEQSSRGQRRKVSINGIIPYQVSIQRISSDGIKEGEHVASGCLFTKFCFVTSAKAIREEKFSGGTHNAVVGILRLKGKHKAIQRRVIKKVVPHEQYNDITFENDIALVIVSEPFRINRHIYLITFAKKPVDMDTDCIISGWGETNRSSFTMMTKSSVTDKLYHVNGTVVEKRNCDKMYHEKLPSVMKDKLCIKGKDQKTRSCVGGIGAGSPLLCNNKLYGIVAVNDYDKCKKSEFALITSFNAHLKWIKGGSSKIVQARSTSSEIGNMSLDHLVLLFFSLILINMVFM